MSVGGILPGLGASSLRAGTINNGRVDIYVDKAAGLDTNPGSIDQPLNDLPAAYSLIPDHIVRGGLNTPYPVYVHLKSGTYAGIPFRPHLLESPVVVYGDDVWDPSVLATVRTGVAVAGTTGAVVVDAGLVVDAFYGKFMEFSSGPAVGQRRQIRHNTATNIELSAAFAPAPVPGDNYRIFDPTGVTITYDAAAGGNLAAVARGSGFLSVGSTTSNDPAFAPVVFSQMTLSTTALRLAFGGGGTYLLYGVKSGAALGVDFCYLGLGCDIPQGVEAPAPAAQAPKTLFNLTDTNSWLGYGFSWTRVNGSLRLNDRVSMYGYITTAIGLGTLGLGLAGGGCTFFLLGGSIAGNGVQVGDTVGGGNFSSFGMAGGRFTSTLLVGNGGTAVLLAGDISTPAANAIFVLENGTVKLASAVTGSAAVGLSVNAKNGGKVFLNGAPNFGRGGGALDYDVGNGAPQDKTFFGAVGVTMNHVDGSIITRTS